ncbi:MAG: type I glyceraldehyde-3-phosphate dehydrogenase [Parvibaculales bacterium]
MTTRVAINGFGRIGRMTLRGIIESKRKDVEIVALNSTAGVENSAFLLQHDTVHGRFNGKVKHTKSTMNVGSGPFKVFSERDPSKLPWADLGIDVVLECTGAFNSKEASAVHLQSGAKRVLISAPAKNVDHTVVYGVNHKSLRKSHKIVSNASCTTNALAPLAMVLDELCGIKSGYMTTIHAYTGDQRLVDSKHSDLRRARGAAQSMIPTSTGAAKALGLVLPQLAGKLDGTAIRVPTPNVSLVDLVFTPKSKTSIDAIHAAMKKASKGKLKGVLGCEEVPLVSSDFNHHPCSSIYDATATQMVGNALIRVAAWYDNEWGFSLRMADTAAAMGKLG